jgi:hypothetical protein
MALATRLACASSVKKSRAPVVRFWITKSCAIAPPKEALSHRIPAGRDTIALFAFTDRFGRAVAETILAPSDRLNVPPVPAKNAIVRAKSARQVEATLGPQMFVGARSAKQDLRKNGPKSAHASPRKPQQTGFHAMRIQTARNPMA